MPKMLVDQYGRDIDAEAITRTVATGGSSPNLDPTFFFPTQRGRNISAGDITERPYRYHSWVYAAISYYARNLSRIPLVLRNKKTKKLVEDKWGILHRFDRPNQFMTRTTFWQMIIIDLLLPAEFGDSAGGQSFVVPKTADRDDGTFDLDVGKTPDVFLPYNEKYFKPSTTESANKMRNFLGWRFRIPGHTEDICTYSPNQVIRIYQTNPYDWLSGLASYESARIAMCQDIKADLFNTRMFDNDAVPAGILKSDGFLNPQQRRETMAAWYETYGGPGNSKRVAVMDKSFSFEKIGQSPDDMQFKETKSDAFEKIVSAFGLNKIALGKYEQINRATIVEGRRILWGDSLLPLQELILEGFNAQWVSHFRDDIELASDLSGVDALKPDALEAYRALPAMTQASIPVSLAMQLLGVPLPEDAIAKYPWLDQKPVDAANSVAEPEVPAAAPTTEPPKKSAIIVRLTIEQIADSFIRRVFDPGEAKLQKRLIKFFARQRNLMQDKVDKWLQTQKAISRAFKLSPEIFLLDVDAEDSELLVYIKPYLAEQLKAVEENLKDKYPEGLINWSAHDANIEKYTKQRMRDLKRINGTTNRYVVDHVKDAIEQGVKDELNPYEMAKEIKAAIGTAGEVRKNQSKTIARTENGIVSGMANHDALKESGLGWREWLTASDERVRDSHATMNEQVRHMEDPFVDGDGNRLSHPSDPMAPAGTIINCRCVEIGVQNSEGDIYV